MEKLRNDFKPVIIRRAFLTDDVFESKEEKDYLRGYEFHCSLCKCVVSRLGKFKHECAQKHRIALSELENKTKEEKDEIYNQMKTVNVKTQQEVIDYALAKWNEKK